MAAWRDWHGGACPTIPDALVRLRFHNGRESSVDQRAGGFNWRHQGDPFSIVAYRIVDVPEEAKR